jgi:hypothetical protein
MPQLVKAANDAVLEVFSTKLGSVASTLAQTSEDRTILQGILRELLASQMSKIDFFYSKELSKSDYSGMYVSQPKVQRSSPKVALAFLKKCVDAGHPSLAMIAIKHITNMNKIAPLEAQARAKSVLLPLVPLLLADSKLRAALPNELVVCLGRTAVKLCLDHVQTHARHISQHELGQLLDVAEASSNVALIAKTYVCRFFSYPFSSSPAYTACYRCSRPCRGAMEDGMASSKSFIHETSDLLQNSVISIELLLMKWSRFTRLKCPSTPCGMGIHIQTV